MRGPVRHIFCCLVLGIVLFMGLASQVLAQAQNSFRHLQKSDGLSQSSVFSIAQDSAGFMWFGTRDGLNRYDGYDFRIYRPDSNGLGPIGNDIRKLHYDQSKRGMWVGTTDGLSYYCPRMDRFKDYTEVKGAIRDISHAKGGQLWVTSSKGLFRYVKDEDTFESIVLAGIDDSAINVTAVVEQNDSLWVASNRGLYSATKQAGRDGYFASLVQYNAESIVNQWIESLYLTENGTLFIGTFENGVFRYDTRTGVTTNYRNAPGDETTIADDNIRAILPDEQGGLWIATFNGLSQLDIATETIQTSRLTGLREDELSDNSIHCLFKDSRGSIWMGTYYGGVNHLDPIFSRFRSYVHTTSEASLKADIVSSFAEDGQGNIYVGTEGGGLDYLNTSTDLFTHFSPAPGKPNSLSGSNVKSLLLDGDQLWIGTFKEGLNVLDIPSGKFRTYRAQPFKASTALDAEPWLPHNNVYSLLKYGKYIWAGTYGGGLSILDPKKETFRNYTHDPENEESIGANLVSVIYQKNARFWVGSDAGLQRVFTDDLGLPIRFETVLSDKRVRVIYEDEQGILWIGTLNKGLYRIEQQGKMIRHYTADDGLAGNTVFGILEDDQAKLWISTNDGLSRFDPSSAQFTNFEYPSGLTSGEFNVGAYFKMSNGELLFGGLDGFTRFQPSEIKNNTFESSLAFTELRKNGQDIRPGEDAALQKAINNTDRLKLAYNDANFTIGIAALDYVNPESNNLQYMLEGLDSQWKNAKGKVQATYTIQREGDYKLLVRTVGSDGEFSEIQRQLNITVLPPPWRTWWAYVGYIFLAALGFYAVFRFFNLRHNYQLEHLARQRDEELHEGKLRFFTNITHEFRTPLTLILGPLGDVIRDKSQTPEAMVKLTSIERNSRKLLDLVDRVLTFRQLASEHGRVRGRRNDLNWFLRNLHEPFVEEARRRRIRLTLDAGTESLWVWYDTRMLEMAVAGLLSNALKFTPDGGAITLSGKQISDAEVEIRVVDNGPGVADELKPQIFQRFFEDPAQANRSGSGIGLSVAKDLIELHQGTIDVEDTPGGGATFVVKLPIGRQHFSSSNSLDSPLEDDSLDPSIEIEKSLAQELTFIEPAGEEEQVDLTEEPGKEKILIVEDNDELREYLKEVFDPFYQVYLAADGLEGVAMAISTPALDIIVSDVMMPNMDGFELCKKVKTNLKTSHIPVLLLTAKIGDHAKLEGLRIGADDYIPKPFVHEELLLRVRNSLLTRKRVRETFSRVINLDPKEISVTSADEEFLINALAFMEDHIDDLDLNVVRLASALNVSRALLFTKLKALTNQTPGNFIKGVRIKRAAQLLATNKLNVAEVAYKVGFRDPKYFSKCFKEEYGVSASTYSKEQKVE